MPPGLKLLVVDDESGIVVMCQHLLELASYDVITATNPNEALEIAQNQAFDLLLTDIRLPEMDGFELIARIQQIQPEVAVVVMTGYRTVETAIKALRSGVDGLVIKPFELGTDLLEIVEQALNNNRKKRSSVSLPALQPLFRLSGTSMIEATPASVEKTVVQSLAELLEAQHAGVYVRPAGVGGYQLVEGRGALPAEEDPFWSSPQVTRATQGEAFIRSIVTPGEESLPPDLLREHGWSGLLLVSIRRRKEHWLFFAARDQDSPAFLRRDLDLLTVLARQACTTLENVRLFTNLAGLAQRVERSNGVLQQAEKMSVIEKVVPALSQEINNPVQSIKNNLYMAGRQDNRERQSYYLTLAQKELYRLEGSLQRMISLCQPPCEDEVSIEVETLMKQVLDSLAAKLRELNVQVRTNYARPLPAFHGQRDQIELVLFSLMLNAMEALSEVQGERVLWIDGTQEENCLVLAIEDSGAGLPAGVRENIFKPFFTTHPERAGLGLVVSQRIVEAHGGKLACVDPRHGTGGCLEIRMSCEGKH